MLLVSFTERLAQRCEPGRRRKQVEDLKRLVAEGEYGYAVSKDKQPQARCLKCPVGNRETGGQNMGLEAKEK